MTKKSSLIIFIVVVVILITSITLWANKKDASSTVSPTPSESTSPSVSGTQNPSASPSTSGATYTMSQVAQHKTQADCWTTINGKVYNLTAFISQHPGGVPNIMKVCGIDGTATFTAQHGGKTDPMAALASLQIGILAQ